MRQVKYPGVRRPYDSWDYIGSLAIMAIVGGMGNASVEGMLAVSALLGGARTL